MCTGKADPSGHFITRLQFEEIGVLQWTHGRFSFKYKEVTASWDAAWET
jgi:hypothetical protein